MTAAVYRRFGGPDVVRIEELPTPRPRGSEVLVRVHASTVSAADHRARTKDVPRGLALPSSLMLGIFRPRRKILGMDVAGVVEAVGDDVTAFAPGDEVIAMLGARFGGHAQYVTIPQGGPIAKKPRNVSFEESAALVFGGVTARAFLDRARVRPGSTVLVNGASGAVGTAAVQLAKLAGAYVTGVTSGGNAALVASLGADRVIDYAAVDFATEGRTYDVILDAVGNAQFGRVAGLINPGGALLQVIGDLGDMVGAGRRSRRSGLAIVVGNVPFTAEQLASLVDSAEAGRFHPVIDRTFDLADIAEAHRYVDTGRKRGTVVVRVAHPLPAVAQADAGA
jgi:NADPH:quinone reductase-like Zn-dependent oxidoreductase